MTDYSLLQRQRNPFSTKLFFIPIKQMYIIGGRLRNIVVAVEQVRRPFCPRRYCSSCSSRIVKVVAVVFEQR